MWLGLLYDSAPEHVGGDSVKITDICLCRYLFECVNNYTCPVQYYKR